MSTTKGHRTILGKKTYCTYTVCDNRTGVVVATDATAEEAAAAMGIKFSSFYAIVNKVKNGKVKRWRIEKIYDDDRKNFHALSHVPFGNDMLSNPCMKDVPCSRLDGDYSTQDLIYMAGGCYCHECELLLGEREYLQGDPNALHCARMPGFVVRPDGFCSYGVRNEETRRENTL